MIVVGMSGGVDSAVAAYLLKREGHDVVGVFMKNWEEQDDGGECTSTTDWDDVRRVCDTIGVPYYAVNFAKEYWDNVFSVCLDEFAKGRTPNPDVLCNREIKFKAFTEYAARIGASKIATGHFVRTNGMGQLLKGIDLNKDQSYFLYMLKSRQLMNSLFPVGGMTKGQVRELARGIGLPNAAKKDSTGICFIGERRFKEFLKTYIPAQPGLIKHIKTGETVGRHDGLMFYTIGQRRYLGVGGEGGRWYVCKKDLENNILWLNQGNETPELYSSVAVCSGLTWVCDAPQSNTFDCKAKFRYREEDKDVSVEVLDGGRCVVRTREPERAITPGQSVVFYDGDIVLGGAIVE